MRCFPKPQHRSQAGLCYPPHARLAQHQHLPGPPKTMKVTGSLTRQWALSPQMKGTVLSLAPSQPQQECCIQSSFPGSTWRTFTFTWPCHTLRQSGLGVSLHLL